MKYDINSLNKLSGNMYLLSKGDISSAVEDILSLNNFLKKAKCKNKISASDLKFQGRENVCYIEYTPLTPKGKKSKFPQILHFFTTDSGYDVVDNVFGEIHYFENGDIGKVKVVHWDRKGISVVECAIINEILSLNKVTKKDPRTGENIVIFKAVK